MCTDRHIYWKCLHKHSTESPSTACEFHLINLRYPAISPLDPEVSHAYRAQHLSNQTKCAAIHSVVDLVFEHHVCDTCELQAAVVREELKALERQVEKEASLLRVARRAETFERWVLGEEESTFEEFLEEERLKNESSEENEEVREVFERNHDVG